MAYIMLWVVGLVSLLFVSSKWKRGRQVIVIFVTVICGTILYVAIDLLLTGGANQKSVSSVWEKVPWIDIGLYFAMLVGMTAKYFYDAIGEGNTISFRRWQFFKPMLISPLVFGVIYTQASENIPVVSLLIFSFQNGFFWHTVLANRREH